MKQIINNLFFLCMLSLTFFSCNQNLSCPEGNLCVNGNELEYQANVNGAKIFIDCPENVVYNNSAVIISDLIPGYPASVNYNKPDFHFGGGMFKIEPTDLPLKGLLTITIQYPKDAVEDQLGNQWAEDYVLYYIEKDNWQIINNSINDVTLGTVSGQVNRLGIYAVGTPKDCLVGDWRLIDPFDTLHDYSHRVVFLNTHKGWRELLVDCDTSAAGVDYQYSHEDFSWSLEKDTMLNVFDFLPVNACGISGTIPAADIEDIIVRCDGNFLELEGFNFTWNDQFIRFE